MTATNAENPTAPPTIEPIGILVEVAADSDVVSTCETPDPGVGVVIFIDTVSMGTFVEVAADPNAVSTSAIADPGDGVVTFIDAVSAPDPGAGIVTFKFSPDL